jgi:hypothetical protein
VATKQRSYGSVNVKNADITHLEAIAYVRSINGNLTAKNEAGIGGVLGDGSDLKLGLHLALQPNIDVVKNTVADQMASLGELCAEQPGGRRCGGGG